MRHEVTQRLLENAELGKEGFAPAVEELCLKAESGKADLRERSWSKPENLRKMKSIFYLSLLIAGIHADEFYQQNSSYHNSFENYHNGNGIDSANLSGHKVERSICQFSFYLYRVASSYGNNRNVFFSPMSISTAFAMLTLGAKSETLQQILRVLRFTANDIQEREVHEGFRHLMQTLNHQNTNFHLDMGNVLFVQDQLKLQKQFLRDLENFYEGEAVPENFRNFRQARQQISKYIENKTRGKIVNLLNDLDPATEILLVNYIYLKATWNKTFNPKYTKDGDFFVNGNTVVKVPMMFRMGICKHAYDGQLSSTVVQMDYKERGTAYFILPDEGQMRKLETGLSCESLSRWRKLVSESSTNIFLPRFSIHGKLDLEKILSHMGITKLFTNEADLSGITGQPTHKISKAIHQATMNVEESGTEASAATAMEMVPMSVPVTITFNRPFLIVIVLNNNILFTGKVVNPLEK
uniref:Thyroxine-binding globulin n=1 Tax=Pelusios castaneus TaxID=367368 RepID=A0A8C8RWW1_9SAUR